MAGKLQSVPVSLTFPRYHVQVPLFCSYGTFVPSSAIIDMLL